MRLNLGRSISSSKMEIFIVMSQFIVIALHFIEINLFNKKLIQTDYQIFDDVGNIIIFLALTFIIISIKDLGKYISPFPRPKEKSELITSGIYSIISHPMYYSLILISIGFFIKSFTLYNLILSILLSIIVSIKINLEEGYLTKKFINYKLYKRKVKI
tara:strand:+ start:2644 stop:3117 length:474 start_codon:yes stop_codon:yes gene_type:complete